MTPQPEMIHKLYDTIMLFQPTHLIYLFLVLKTLNEIQKEAYFLEDQFRLVLSLVSLGMLLSSI